MISQNEEYPGNPSQRLTYIADLVKELRDMSARDFPSLSELLGKASDEARRLHKIDRGPQ